MRSAVARAVLLTVIAATVVPSLSAGTNGPSSTERAKIEALISAIGNLSDARFIRNGREYGAATAAKFLRGKWKDRAAEVVTAEDFINEIATRSSTTGRPYLIRFSDGREVTTAAYLRRELARLQ